MKTTRFEKCLRAAIIGIALFGLAVNLCRAQDGKRYIRKGDNFIEQGTTRTAAKDSTKTAYTYTTKAGETYPIFLSAKGRAYIGRTSKKTGKYYRQYMPKEIQDQIK